MRQYRIGNALPMGATLLNKKTVQFVVKNTGKSTGLILYEKKTGKEEVIPFDEAYRIGNVFSLVVEGIDPDKYTYNFIQDGQVQTDPYAKSILGNEIWGRKDVHLSAGIGMDEFCWEGDQPLLTPFKESIFYQLHVRGFTRHNSSGVKKKGTFEGIVEKLPYLKELGITAIELLPAYEFVEVESRQPTAPTMEYIKENYKLPPKTADSSKINYWGFKEGWYFAPKASYCAGKHPRISFKTMVKELHREGIEVIMQFYFTPQISRVYLMEVLRFWVQEYHVDGFRLLGTDIPMTVLASDPVLWNTKLLYEDFDGQKFYEKTQAPVYRNIATSNDGYLYALRHFLKGDVGSLYTAFQAMLFESPWAANMVYLTNYNSFTLMDMVSYDRKHNEANMEEGRDGNNYNISWNCGIEGPSKRKNIVLLRQKQLRNAMTFLLFSQGTPLILSGDEFGNSQGGNNNPYCQDNNISWLNWKDLDKNKAHFLFTKEMISLRKNYLALFQQVSEKKFHKSADYPSLSFHGREAWKLDQNTNEEAGGILFYSEPIYLYLGINMHWQETTLALPNLSKESRWELLLDTSLQEEKGKLMDGKAVNLRPRSIIIMTAKGNKSEADENLSAF